MSGLHTRNWPSGYRPLRILSEGEGGVVALAGKSSGEFVALKLLPLAANANPDEALARHSRLAPLTTSPGLLRIRECGLSPDRRWLWEELDLADDLPAKATTPPSPSERILSGR